MVTRDMADLSEGEIEVLLSPYITDYNADLLSKLKLYLDLLMKWNDRTNLTAIRDPEGMVRRHFGESLFAAQRIGNPSSLLDYGSGAGFPGIPIALLRTNVMVTLAESQGKKAAFLHEAVRVLELSAEVWGGRVEEMRGKTFDCVTLRSVDGMAGAVAKAWSFADRGVALLTTVPEEARLTIGAGFEFAGRDQLPESLERLLLRYSRVSR